MNSKLLSRYRSVLMGIAIMEVMLGHIFSWSHVNIGNSLLAILFTRLIYLVHTPGFLLLSGLGLYYSYSKNPNILEFYKRRFSRLVVPFMVMAVPLYGIISYQSGGINILRYVGWITSLGYWFGDSDMWYISLSIVLYLSFPFLYKLIENYRSGIVIFCMIVVSVMLAYFLYKFWPTYFSLVYLAVPKIPMFLIGAYLGYIAYSRKKLSGLFYFGISIFLVFLFFLLSRKDNFFSYYVDLSIFIITIPVVALLYDKAKVLKPVEILMTIWNWLGKYTLELYVVHILLHRIFSTYTLAENIVIILFSLLICKILHDAIDKFKKRILRMSF